ncbi:hypothetical protein Tco_1134603 [Tanacetum coccineum]
MCIRTINLKVEVEKIIGRGIGFVDVEITFTPQAKQYEGVAARVLENIGADQATFARSSLLKLPSVEEKFQECLKPTTSLPSHFPGRTGDPFIMVGGSFTSKFLKACIASGECPSQIREVVVEKRKVVLRDEHDI